MRLTRSRLGLAAVVLAGGATLAAIAADVDPRIGAWGVHDMTRPKPPIVTPGTPSTPETPGTAPSDAIVLFDGKNIDQWTGGAWTVEGGAMLAGKGPLRTKESFGDCQLHIELSAPTPP